MTNLLPSIDQAFIHQFEAEIKLAYQRFGSRLQSMVRHSDQVVGAEVRFQKIGKGEAQSKSRHGDVPVLNLEYSFVDAVIVDSYAGEYIDRLDTLKTNVDTRSAVVRTIAAALGRRADRHITDAANQVTSGNNIGTNSDGLTKAKLIKAQEVLNARDVPADGDRFMPVGAQQWSNLLAIDEFVNTDYIGFDQLPFLGGMQAKRYLDWFIFMFTGLPMAASDDQTVLAWHKTAMGLGNQDAVSVSVDWVAQKHAHLITGTMAMGAVIIDPEGVLRIPCKVV